MSSIPALYVLVLKPVSEPLFRLVAFILPARLRAVRAIEVFRSGVVVIGHGGVLLRSAEVMAATDPGFTAPVLAIFRHADALSFALHAKTDG